ncbi:MAG: hypothetical protein AB7F42_14235 [Mycolicibacterium sp.]
MAVNTAAAWLWSGRRAVITGRAAAALHRARWVSDQAPIELISDCRRPPAGIITRDQRIGGDEVVQIRGMAVASVERTAFDLGRYLPSTTAVMHLDALGHATGVTPAQVMLFAQRYRGARGVRKLRAALARMDAGSESPKETWLRLLLIKQGFPPPTTQIPLYDTFGEVSERLDMGWEDMKIAVEYDGDQHRSDREQYVHDEERLRSIRARGWLHIKVINEDQPAEIRARVRAAWELRERAFTLAAQVS